MLCCDQLFFQQLWLAHFDACCFTQWFALTALLLLCFLIVDIHASGISIPLSLLMFSGWSLIWIASLTLRDLVTRVFTWLFHCLEFFWYFCDIFFWSDQVTTWFVVSGHVIAKIIGCLFWHYSFFRLCRFFNKFFGFHARYFHRFFDRTSFSLFGSFVQVLYRKFDSFDSIV